MRLEGNGIPGAMGRQVTPNVELSGNVRLWSQDTEAVRSSAAELGVPLTPLYSMAPGWRFERDDMNRIVVTMPDGGGCVVDSVAKDQRMVPEEVLFALCKALGA